MKSIQLPFGKRSQGRDDDASTYWVTPWKARTDDGLYIGHNGQVWLYRELVLAPMMWEDPATRLRVASPLENALYDLAQTSKDGGLGLQTLTRSREIHIAAVTWETPSAPPEGTPVDLASFLSPVLQFTSPSKALVLGVRLWPSIASSGSTLRESVSKFADRVVKDGPLDLAPFEKDIETVNTILARNGARDVPSKEARAHLESWFNRGNGPHVTVVEYETSVFVDKTDRIEVAAVQEFEIPAFTAPNAPWAMTAQTHPAGAQLISVRGQLDPPSVARARLRRSERKIKAAMDEEAKTGDLDRPELSAALQAAEQAERFVMSGREPLVSNCSIVMARRVGPDAPDTYIDELGDMYGMEVIPLPHRQMDAIDETLPTSSKRTNPFLQDVSIAMLAHAGLQSYSNLGDGTGLFTGVVDPDGALCWLNPKAAPALNKAPMTLIAGRPGSGKTFLASVLAVQAAKAHEQVIFVNPKGSDSLSGIADLTDGRVVKLTEIEQEGGYFDPFSYCSDPQIAASIAQNHILTVLGSRGGYEQGFRGSQEIALVAGLRDAAAAGVRCVGEAFPYIDAHDPTVTVEIQRLASDPLFRLGIAMEPRERPPTDKSLVLIEFDRALPFPEGSDPASYNLPERLAIAAVQLVTRAASELLANSRGGMLVVDEAWMFLKSQEGMAALNALGRLGRSQNILPVLITQRVKDFVSAGVDMEEYISRVFAMALSDKREAEAALELCGLEITEERIEFLREAGPEAPTENAPGRPALALHRDLHNRHAAVLVGPWPNSLRLQLSTNPVEREQREAWRAAQSAVVPTAPPVPAVEPPAQSQPAKKPRQERPNSAPPGWQSI